MGRFEVERQNFIHAYTRLLVSSWSDDLYLKRLLESPHDVLSEAGLEIPDSVAIRIERNSALISPQESSEAALNAQIDLWLNAEERGELVLYVPDAPVIATENLNAADLSRISGGNAVVCCCCPCSCCV